MRRFFIDTPLTETITITHADARHIAAVLRLTAGTILLVSDPEGKSGKAEIIAATPDAVSLKLLEYVNDSTEPPLNVWLAQGLAKGEKMDLIVQKAVELGVYGIIPVITEHAVVRYDAAKQADKVARWQRIAREAAKQCRRNYVPQVYPIAGLEAVVTHPEFAAATKIMLYEGQASQGIKQVLTEKASQAYIIMIGPEGGFSPAEVELCQKHNGKVVTMGPRIMRTETAAIAALATVMYECGDLGG